MTYLASVKALMLEPDENGDSEMVIHSVGDIDRLIRLIRQTVDDIADEAGISADMIHKAVSAKSSGELEHHLEEIYEELMKRGNDDEVKSKNHQEDGC